MKSVLAATCTSVMLCGCAMMPSTVTPLKVTVYQPTLTDMPAGSLKLQTYNNLSAAATRRDLYTQEYTNLNNEQHVRDAAILAASIGLSATTVFRGDVNNLKFAGFLLGLTTFYDKAIPLSTRIASAQSAFYNYDTLIESGNYALGDDLDGDKIALDNGNLQLSVELDVAGQLVKQYSGGAKAQSTCAIPATQVACLKDQLSGAQQNIVDIVTLQASINAGNTALTSGKAARQALVSIPLVVTSTADSIDKTAWSGIAFTVDQTLLGQGFTASAPAKAPAPGEGAHDITPPAPGGAAPTPTPLAAENTKLVTATKVVQAILNRVDYVSLAAQIKASAPPVGGTATTKANSTPSPGATGTPAS